MFLSTGSDSEFAPPWHTKIIGTLKVPYLFGGAYAINGEHSPFSWEFSLFSKYKHTKTFPTLTHFHHHINLTIEYHFLNFSFALSDFDILKIYMNGGIICVCSLPRMTQDYSNR